MSQNNFDFINYSALDYSIPAEDTVGAVTTRTDLVQLRLGAKFCTFGLGFFTFLVIF
jgi:hypothetical protein